MKIKELYSLGHPADLLDDSLDVFVVLEDEFSSEQFPYLVEVTTPEFICASMKRSGSDFLEPSFPYILVSKLTKEIIRAAIQAYVDDKDDSFWLKLYHIAPTLNIDEMNKILQQKKEENAKFDAEMEAAIKLDLEEEKGD